MSFAPGPGFAQGRGCEGPACSQAQVPRVLQLPAWAPAPFPSPLGGFRLSAKRLGRKGQVVRPRLRAGLGRPPRLLHLPLRPDSHHPGRTSRRRARDSATGATRESWYPSCRASTGSTGPASHAPLRTGPASCLPPASSSCPARARGVSLLGPEDALGRERPGAPPAGEGHRGGCDKDGGETEEQLGHLERAGPRQAEGQRRGARLGEGPGARSRPEGAIGRRLSAGRVLGRAEQGLEAGLVLAEPGRRDWLTQRVWAWFGPGAGLR